MDGKVLLLDWAGGRLLLDSRNNKMNVNVCTWKDFDHCQWDRWEGGFAQNSLIVSIECPLAVYRNCAQSALVAERKKQVALPSSSPPTCKIFPPLPRDFFKFRAKPAHARTYSCIALMAAKETDAFISRVSASSLYGIIIQQIKFYHPSSICPILLNKITQLFDVATLVRSSNSSKSLRYLYWIVAIIVLVTITITPWGVCCRTRLFTYKH